MNGLFASSCQSANFNPLSTFSVEQYDAFYAKLAGWIRCFSRDEAYLFAGAGIEHICVQSEKGKFNHLDPTADLEAFCFKVAKRKVITDLKEFYTKKIPVVSKDISDIFNGFDLEDSIDYDFSDERELMKEIVSNLNGKGAEVLKLWLSDYSDKEIAEMKGITLNNVRKSRHEYKDKVVKEMHARGYGRRSGNIKAKESAKSPDSADSSVYLWYSLVALEVPQPRYNTPTATHFWAAVGA